MDLEQIQEKIDNAEPLSQEEVDFLHSETDSEIDEPAFQAWLESRNK